MKYVFKRHAGRHDHCAFLMLDAQIVIGRYTGGIYHEIKLAMKRSLQESGSNWLSKGTGILKRTEDCLDRLPGQISYTAFKVSKIYVQFEAFNFGQVKLSPTNAERRRRENGREACNLEEAGPIENDPIARRGESVRVELE